MTLIRGFLCTAGRNLFVRNTSIRPMFGAYNRAFSAAAALTRDQVDERILGVLRAFDRVNKDKVQSSLWPPLYSYHMPFV